MSGANDDAALFDYLVSEYNQPVGWTDWSYLKGRRVALESSTEQPWDYVEVVVAAMKGARAMLDIRTGDGEKLAGLATHHPLPPLTCATEGHPPHAAIARERLAPLGVAVYEVDDDRLPFTDEQFDLVINRNSSYEPREVWRVIKPGGRFITLQVGDQTNREIYEWLGTEQIIRQGGEVKSEWNPRSAGRELEAVGWQMVTELEHFWQVRYYDIGAIVCYLKIVPWQVRDFSVEGYFPQLRELHGYMQRVGYLDVTFHSFLMVAQKANG